MSDKGRIRELEAEVLRLREERDALEVRTVFHPSEFIKEEMAARGWTLDYLARRMSDGSDKEWGICRLALDFYFDIGPEEPGMRIDAPRIAKAFGTTESLWLNLETAWLARMPLPAPPAAQPSAGDAPKGGE